MKIANANNIAFRGHFVIDCPNLTRKQKTDLGKIITDTMKDRADRGIIGANVNIVDANGRCHVLNGDEGSFIDTMLEAAEKNKFESVGLKDHEQVCLALNHVVSQALKSQFETFFVKKPGDTAAG